jgi:SOS-response transcriptional repressor LexA
MSGRRSGDDRRSLILAAIVQFHDLNGYSPSLRELSDASGVGLSSTAYHVGVLVSEGRLSRVRLRPRSLRVVEAHSRESG